MALEKVLAKWRVLRDSECAVQHRTMLILKIVEERVFRRDVDPFRPCSRNCSLRLPFATQRTYRRDDDLKTFPQPFCSQSLSLKPKLELAVNDFKHFYKSKRYYSWLIFLSSED